MEKLKYFWLRLSHDGGKSYIKTACKDRETAVNNTILMENCPESAIECIEVPKALWAMGAKIQWNKFSKFKENTSSLCTTK